jgi:hypothetical protein
MTRESGGARTAALWFAALAIAAVACGPDKPASRDADAAAPQKKEQQRPRSVVKAILVGGMRVRLDSTVDFAEVERALGSAVTADPLDHDDSWKICYELPNSRDAKYVIFMANEVGGAEHRVLGVRLLRDKPPRLTVRCSPTTARVDSVVADNGTHLGMSRDSIVALVGGAPNHTETVDDWEYHDIVTTKPGDSVNHVWPIQHEIISSCIVTFLDGRSTDIQWWYAAIS